MKRIIAACISTIMVACIAISAAADDPIGIYDSWKPDLKEYTSQVCDEYGVDYSLALGVIYNESRFKSGLTHMNSNGTTDYGLMQVNEVNFKYLNKTLGITSMNQLLDDRVGIRCEFTCLPIIRMQQEMTPQLSYDIRWEKVHIESI